MAYLKQQYKVVGIFFRVLSAALSVISFGFRPISPIVPFALITGGFFSGLAGFIGMVAATKSNARGLRFIGLWLAVVTGGHRPIAYLDRIIDK
jgi:Na+/H+-translocating membrane pyrophosphatase